MPRVEWCLIQEQQEGWFWSWGGLSRHPGCSTLGRGHRGWQGGQCPEPVWVKLGSLHVKVVLRVSLMSWGHALGDRFRKGFGSGVEEGKELDRSRSSWGLEALGDVSSSDSVAA